MQIEEITDQLFRAVDRLTFGPPVAAVYNPLAYARQSHDLYLKRFGQTPRENLLIGMNPGPWGMAQTGVPFGAVPLVREWLGIEAPVDRPAKEHPKKPVDGFGCKRVEVSGKRLWGWARDTFGTAECFFERFFVINYCPLLFLEAGGRNLTPDKLSAAEQRQVTEPCDRALQQLVEYFQPTRVIGVGAYAEKRCKTALKGFSGTIGRVLHPSPASPAANRGWSEAANKQFANLGLQFSNANFQLTQQ